VIVRREGREVRREEGEGRSGRLLCGDDARFREAALASCLSLLPSNHSLLAFIREKPGVCPE
jgi:hypothetical protein